MPSVLLTRPRARTAGNDPFHETMRTNAIEIVELPMIRFELPRELDSLQEKIREAAHGAFDHIIVSSTTAADFLMEQSQELGLLSMLKTNGSFGAIGHVTAERLVHLGFTVTLPIPQHAGSEQLIASLAEFNLTGKRILLLQSQIGLDVLEASLRTAGAAISRQILYYTKGPTLGDTARLIRLLESTTRPDVVAFFSPSSVTHFVRAIAEMSTALLRSLPALACIGETTAKTVEELLHRRPEIVARKSDQESLAQDIIAHLNLAHQ